MWIISPDRPVYVQLMEVIISRIISGEYKAGEKLPSVRDLALEASVNPNTMQKAFAELERDGLVYTQRTSGRFVTDDLQLIQNMRDNLALGQIKEFLFKMKQLGYNAEQTITLIKNNSKEMN